MSDVHSLESDIAFMRRMAEDGRRITAPGGPYYLVWGTAIGAGYLATYLFSIGTTSVPIWGSWIGAVVLGYIATAILAVRDSRRPDSNRFVNRVSDTVWTVTSIGMMTFWIGMGIGGGNMGYMAPVGSVMSGVAFALIGSFCRIPFMYVPAAAWFIACLAIFFMSGEPMLTLAMAGFAFSIMAGTGIALILMEKRARA